MEHKEVKLGAKVWPQRMTTRLRATGRTYKLFPARIMNDGLYLSAVYKKAQQLNQPWLYVVREAPELEGTFVLSTTPEGLGDYFHCSDFELIKND